MNTKQLMRDHSCRRHKGEKLIPESGFAIVSLRMEQLAPKLKFDRGDGWWNAQQAFLFETEQAAEEYAATLCEEWRDCYKTEFVNRTHAK